MDKKGWVRPYWHVDAKWIFGILFFFFLNLSLLAYVLTVLTSPRVAVPVATYVVANQFSRNGLDDPKDIEEAKAKFLKSKDKVFYPLPGQNVSITRDELETLSPTEIRLKIFSQIVEPIYNQKRTEETLKQVGVLGFFNYETHELLARIFNISLIPLVLTGSGMVAFSYRYGRLISPAFVFLFVSTLPAALMFIIKNASAPKESTGPLSAVPKEVVLEIVNSISPVFNTLFLTGVGLIFAATVIKLIFRLSHSVNDK